MSLHSAVRMLSGRGPRRWFTSLMRDRASIFMPHRLRNPAIGVDGHTVQFVREALAALTASGAKFVSLRALVANWRAGIRNEAEKGANIKILHVSSVGRFGRMWLSGSEAEILTARNSPVKALEGIDGRPEK